MAEVDDSQVGEEKMENADEESEQSAGEVGLFEVDKIIGRSKLKGSVMYKVRWKGYGPEDDTWEPKENLESCQDLIEEYDHRQDAHAKKRNEERKMRQAIMEGRIESSDSSSDSSSPYPASFKNTFWKELEAGRVNVFENDMYSKVKKRSATLPSQNKDPGSSDSGKPDAKPKADKKRRTHSDPDKDMVKRSKGTSSKRNSKSTSKKIKPAPDHGSSKTKRPESSRCINFGMSLFTDSDTDEGVKPSQTQKKTEPLKSRDGKPNAGSESSDNELLKPSINLVIKKIPEITDDMGKKCSLTRESSSSSYTVLPKHSDSPGINDMQKEDSSSHHSSSKKKKHHKHHKHKSKKSSHQRDSHDKKRKASSTSLTNFQEETSKVPRIDNDCQSSYVLSEQKDNIMTDLKTESNSGEDSPVTHSVSEIPKSLERHDSVESKTIKKEVISETRELTLEKNNNHHEISDSLPAEDLTQYNTNTCRSHCSNITESKCLDLGSVRDTVTGELSSDEHLIRSDKKISRQISEHTLDSGIHSPASEKSEALFRQGSDERLVPLFSTPTLKDIPTDQDLGIALDDIDWDLFDTEVTLEPVTLTNDEFANAVMTGDYQTVKRALIGDGKYDMEHSDPEGKTLLMWSVQHGLDEMSDLLIEHGADINAQMHSGMTALMIACHSGEISTVNLLLELGAKVNLESKDRKTALIYAAKRGHNQILWLLLECGANFNTQCQSGMTALDYVKTLHHSDTEVILTNHITRVMAEFNKQVSTTLNGTAKLLNGLFKPQLFNICDSEKFEIAFQHNLPPPNSGIGYLLFIGHAAFANQEVKCRLYGPSAVRSVTLNGQPQSCLTEEGNFVLAFSPLVDGRNVLTINTINAKDSKAKLIVCACMAQLLQC